MAGFGAPGLQEAVHLNDTRLALEMGNNTWGPCKSYSLTGREEGPAMRISRPLNASRKGHRPHGLSTREALAEARPPQPRAPLQPGARGRSRLWPPFHSRQQLGSKAPGRGEGWVRAKAPAPRVPSPPALRTCPDPHGFISPSSRLTDVMETRASDPRPLGPGDRASRPPGPLQRHLSQTQVPP